MKKNMRVSLSLIIGVIGLLCLVIGSSYALLQDNKAGNKQIINVGKVKLTLTESANGINLTDLTDMTDEEGFSQSTSYSFTVKNDGDAPVKYDLKLIKDTTKTNTLDEKFLKIGLYYNGTKLDAVNLAEVSNIINSSVVIEEGVTDSYVLRIWIDPDSITDSTIEGGATISLKLQVDAEQFFGYDLYSAIAKQVKTANIHYAYVNDANITKNGINYNNDDNGVFLFNESDDNSGTYPIYYYRGNVTNNNVLFANLCWKIVRTTSTGGIKLIYNGEPTNGTCNNTGTASQYGTTSFNSPNSSPADVGYMYGTRYTYSSKTMTSITSSYVYGNSVTYSNGTYTLNTTKTSIGSNWSTDRTTLANGYHYTCFSTSSTCSTIYYITYFGHSSIAYYLTFTGGVNLATAKSNMYADTTNSAIKTKVDSFYTTKLSNYTSYLENTIFCNDRSFSEGEAGGPLLGESINSTRGTYYASNDRAWDRLQSDGTWKLFSLSLKCNNLNDRFSLSTSSGGTSGYGNNKLTYPVGLLTGDEVSLSGARMFTENSNYYLYTGESYYWLMTPYGWLDGLGSHVTVISPKGAYTYVNSTYISGIRPVISLKSVTTFSGGNGTVNSPYVIIGE